MKGWLGLAPCPEGMQDYSFLMKLLEIQEEACKGDNMICDKSSTKSVNDKSINNHAMI